MTTTTKRRRKRRSDFWIGLAASAVLCVALYQFFVFIAPHRNTQPVPVCQTCGDAAPQPVAPAGGTKLPHGALRVLHHLHPHLYQARYIFNPPRLYVGGWWTGLGN